MTQHDKEKIRVLSKNMKVTKLAFHLEDSREILISGYDKETDLYHGSYEYIAMFGSSPIQKAEGQFYYKDVSFIPSGTLFEEYVSELLEVPLFNGGKITSSKVASTFIAKNTVHEFNLPEDATLLIEPYSSTGCFFSPSGEKPFLSIIDGELHAFDTKDAALKFEYDSARVEQKYLGKIARERIESFEKWLDSPEHEEILKKEAEEEEKNIKRLSSLYETGKFHSNLTSLKKMMQDRQQSTISIGSDSFYGEGGEMHLASDLFDCAFLFHEQKQDEKADFYTTYVELEGLRFQRIHGQGVIESISII